MTACHSADKSAGPRFGAAVEPTPRTTRPLNGQHTDPAAEY
jgi:hypothetical protein